MAGAVVDLTGLDRFFQRVKEPGKAKMKWRCLGCEHEFYGSQVRARLHLFNEVSGDVTKCRHRYTAAERTMISDLVAEASEKADRKRARVEDQSRDVFSGDMPTSSQPQASQTGSQPTPKRPMQAAVDDMFKAGAKRAEPETSSNSD